ncbi:Mur ligase family protein [Irregularibacter muris]|uniref:Mur ligase family protein n=1 Tax=Irregularibacter muris TaxID=1796619 RepID=A0AAE3HHR5_9FIRM|nr:Mur ligase family protein [Irregularibacter muris]MCR1899797.1 Mur ligase family protein [Irregularibacter muris]
MEKFSHWIHQPAIIGITGSNGKTTIVKMVEAIFRENAKKMMVIDGLDVKGSEEILNKIDRERSQWITIELCPQSLKQGNFKEIEFDTAIFTNLSTDTVEDKTDFLSMKENLFDPLEKNKRAIINVDDPKGLEMIQGKGDIYAITYGLKSKSTATASSIDVGENIRFNYCLQRTLDSYNQNIIEVQEFPIEINLIGYHNIYNALAAITLALIYEIPVEVIQEALKKFYPVPRRLEYSSLPPYYVVDDYAQNINSLETAFQSIQSLDYHDVFVVMSIGGNKEKSINKKKAETISNWVSSLKIKGLYLTDCKDMENKRETKSTGQKTFLKTLKKDQIPFIYKPCLTESIKEILTKTEEKDLIMLLGTQEMDKGKEIIRANIQKRQQSHYYF